MMGLKHWAIFKAPQMFIKVIQGERSDSVLLDKIEWSQEYLSDQTDSPKDS